MRTNCAGHRDAIKEGCMIAIRWAEICQYTGNLATDKIKEADLEVVS